MWKTAGVVAYVAMKLEAVPGRTRPEQFVDTVVLEAERIAKKHGRAVEIVYYGQPAYARKYLHLQQPLQQQQQR